MVVVVVVMVMVVVDTETWQNVASVYKYFWTAIWEHCWINLYLISGYILPFSFLSKTKEYCEMTRHIPFGGRRSRLWWVIYWGFWQPQHERCRDWHYGLSAMQPHHWKQETISRQPLPFSLETHRSRVAGVWPSLSKPAVNATYKLWKKTLLEDTFDVVWEKVLFCLHRKFSLHFVLFH